MNFWGVTGTNGKTTTVWILSTFINLARKCGHITTVEVDTGARRFSSGYTTPPLKTLESVYSEMESAGMTDCAMEVSSHAIHQDRVGFGTVTPFSGGAFTNISEDHLDYHKTMEEYFKVKLDFAARISRCLKKGGGALPPYVVCTDGDQGDRMLAECRKLPLDVIPVSKDSPAFDLSHLQLQGDFNKSNVLVAAALAEASGVPHEAIQSAIATLKPRWGRLEKIETNSNGDVYIDYAHTPDGLEKVLAAARNFTRGRVIVVFGAGGDRDPMKRPLMGKAAYSLADVIVVTSDNPRSENQMSIINAILSGFPENVSSEREISVIPDRKSAIYHALSIAQSGDSVLICGKGHETYQEIAGVKYPFCDKEIAQSF